MSVPIQGANDPRFAPLRDAFAANFDDDPDPRRARLLDALYGAL